MDKLIEKKIKSGRVTSAVLLTLWVLSLAAMIMSFIIGTEASLGVGVIGLFASVLLPLIYVLALRSYTHLKWMRKNFSSEIASDVVLDKPMLPKSKIFCGSKSFFVKNGFYVIPYGAVQWVYENKMSILPYYFLHLTGGKKLTVYADKDEFKWLLQNYIKPASPEIIIGYGQAQQRAYFERFPSEDGKRKKGLRIASICFIIIAAISMLPFYMEHEFLKGTLISCFYIALGIGFLIAGNRNTK